MRADWDFDCVMHDDGERAATDSVLYLTNIHQLYQREEKRDDEPEEMVAVLGPKPKPQQAQSVGFLERIAERDGTAAGDQRRGAPHAR
jgi:hypothetical protein